MHIYYFEVFVIYFKYLDISDLTNGILVNHNHLLHYQTSIIATNESTGIDNLMYYKRVY